MMKKVLILMVCSLLVGMTTTVLADTFVLQGNYLRVGVSNSGGLIDDWFNAGIMYDPTGTGNFGPADYIRPGSPFEFYSIGMYGLWDTAGYESGNTFGVTTTNTSSGATLSAHSVGVASIGVGLLAINQDLWFDVNSPVINFNVSATNVGTNPISDLVYARGLDPDQDLYTYGTFYTLNSIPAPNRVRAVGPYSLWYIDIEDLSGGGVPTVDWWWDTNPYNLLIPHNDGDGDYTINMAWQYTGVLNPGDSTGPLDFTYNMGVVPEPSTFLLLGAGLVGVGLLRKRFKK